MEIHSKICIFALKREQLNYGTNPENSGFENNKTWDPEIFFGIYLFSNVKFCI